MNGRELSRRFFYDCGLPLLRTRFPHLIERVSAGLLSGGGVMSGGSDVAGYDDEISRDHNWGPRFFLIMTEQDRQGDGPAIKAYLEEHLPTEYCGLGNTNTSFPDEKCFLTTPVENALANTGFSGPPDDPWDWLAIPEHRLFEFTQVLVYYEPAPLMGPVLDGFAYFPDEVWRKRLAFVWFSMALGANGFRTAQRNNLVGTHMFVAWMLESLMRTVFLLRRQYAPHRKWLYPVFQKLTDLPEGLAAMMERTTLNLDLLRIEEQMIRLLLIVGRMANESGLIAPVSLEDAGGHRFGFWNHLTYQFVDAFEATLEGTLKGHPFVGPPDLWGAHFMGLNLAQSRALLAKL